jgi:nucleoside-diphosphate-sugar epimerase
MKPTIAVAGATGNLGGRIAAALLARGANVRAIVRATTASDKIAKLEQRGVVIARVDMAKPSELAAACADAACVVSALLGLRDVMVDGQSALVDAAVAAGVPRFIPSDYSLDFTKIPAGGNRNLDLHRDFRTRLVTAPIASTSILIGMFADLLLYGTPLLDRKAKRVSYWANADQRMDFTTMDDTAQFTAAAALDPSTPSILRASGDQISARELAALAGEIDQVPYELVRAGDLDDVTELVTRMRAAAPESESENFPRWQGLQYSRDMFDGRGTLEPLAKDRYPDLHWTTIRALLSSPRR